MPQELKETGFVFLRVEEEELLSYPVMKKGEKSGDKWKKHRSYSRAGFSLVARKRAGEL